MFDSKIKHFENNKTNSITIDYDVNNALYGENYNDSFYRAHSDAIGEVNLWRAVLLQALIDLKTKSKKRRMQPAKKDAYDFFTNKENEEAVILICECARISYGKLKRAVNEIIKSQNLHEVFR